LADQGVKEVTLLGQTVNAYKSGEVRVGDLLQKVAQIGGIERIRFTSPHPRHYTAELIDTLLAEPKICPHAHIPVQSGSDSVLKKMRRQYTRDEYLRILEKLRGANPLYGISTDIICGFVGETEADFEDTLSLVREAQFDSAFMFAYSPRKGTPSALETEHLCEAEKKERLARLIEVQNHITAERNRLMIGRTETLLIERESTKNPDELVGKTGSFKKVVVPKAEGLQAGSMVDAKITGMRGWTLRGEIIFPTLPAHPPKGV
jgi:tRNA-2-methylthio-N6-dimethylallyladenosine synthase